jgi:hypothetical protein
MTGRDAALTVAVLAGSLGLARADEPYRHARVRVVEPVVTLQSAAEAGSEEAVPNMPFLPGDRVWTDSRGRIEFHFADGSLVRVDSRSKLDYDGYDNERGGQVVLRLWSGSVYVHQRELGRSPEFVIETPNAAVNPRGRGVYRVDADSGETRLSVYDGDAYLDAADRVRVRNGERAFARRGERVFGPERFGRDEEADDFARWDAELGDEAYAAGRNEHLPEELSPYAEDLDRNGSWSFEVGVGNVWRPYVSTSWQPYSFGRWSWTAYGWTWVPNEPWGWAPFHYGRWDYSNGWYWIPGGSWGPGWVSWSAGNDYVGWCPLGFRDRTVVVRDRGRAVPRGSQGASPWTFVRRGDLGARDLARRRVESNAVPIGLMRVVEQGRARVTREGTIAEGGAVPRNIRTRPGVGDTVPELRTDNMTTIPFPVARTRYESERERERERQDPSGANPSWSPRGRRQPTDGGVRPDVQGGPDVSGWDRRRSVAADQAGSDATPSPEAVRRRPEPSRTEDGDREALRPWFRRLSRPRDDDRPATTRGEQASPRQRSRPEDSPRAEPQQLRSEPRRERERVSPPPPPQPRNDGGQDRGAVRRERKRDHQ